MSQQRQAHSAVLSRYGIEAITLLQCYVTNLSLPGKPCQYLDVDHFLVVDVVQFSLSLLSKSWAFAREVLGCLHNSCNSAHDSQTFAADDDTWQ